MWEQLQGGRLSDDVTFAHLHSVFDLYSHFFHASLTSLAGCIYNEQLSAICLSTLHE
jgi:hypothetical protein